MPVAMDINEMTKHGTESLRRGDLDSALKSFKQALHCAEKQQNGDVQRACAFNLGAVHIARREPDKGLAILRRAVPPGDQLDGASNGDLYYNFGLGYELQGNLGEAVKYLELALEEYRAANQSDAEQATLFEKVASLYAVLNIPLQAARNYSLAASVYAGLQEEVRQIEQLCEQASQLMKAGKKEAACQVADQCVIICQNVLQNKTLGRVYNELGLVYSQSKDFSRAAICFELALPSSPHGSASNKSQQAVILQNLAATYNSLHEYQRALPIHENAATLYGKLGNRKAQGQCLINLAFAHTQLVDHESAGDCYRRALQAAKETGNKHDQWQSMEGLGAVAIHDSEYDKAVQYFQAAITTLAASGEPNEKAQKRLVAKLTDALQRKLINGREGNSGVAGHVTSGVAIVETGQKVADDNSISGEDVIEMVPMEIYVNGMPPQPPAALQQNEMKSRIKFRQEQRNKKVSSHFKRVALGMGGYDYESDLSLSCISSADRKDQRIEKMHSDFERVALGVGGYNYESDLSVSHVSKLDRVPRRKSRSSSVSSDMKDGRKSVLGLAPRTTQSEGDVPGRQKRKSRRRRKQRPLLRHSTFNSQQYWERNMKAAIGSSSLSEDEYRERLHPPSTDDETEENERNPHHSAAQSPRKTHRQTNDSHNTQPESEKEEEQQSSDQSETASESEQQLQKYAELLKVTEKKLKSYRDVDRSRSTIEGESSNELADSTLRDSLIKTYEKPIPSPKKTDKDHPANYPSSDDQDTPEASGFQHNDPIYQSIRSNDDIARMKTGSPPPPPPPPPPLPDRPKKGQFDQMSRAQQEVFLKNYHHQRAKKQEEEEEEEEEEEDKETLIQEPKTNSSTCVIL